MKYIPDNASTVPSTNQGGIQIHRFRSGFLSPARIAILGFLMLIGVGTAFLLLPEASTGHALSLVDALFTATSASCVTGLVVVDTGTALSLFGQLTVLGLIQVGGLGIMTISTLFLLLARRRPGLTGQIMIRDTFTRRGERGLAQVIRDVVVFTLVIEAVGIGLLFLQFLPEKDTFHALYLALFHSISAFCNAGFSLFANSFVGYRENWAINLVLSFLIITGGLGFLVLSELQRHFPHNRRTWSRLSLHSKIVLSSTGFLIAFGTLMFLFTEWYNALSSFSLPSHFLGAFFQSVTARTAGFNTVDIGGLANETLFFLILLMFVGASPGSCGGGIKTTAFASLIVLGFSRLRGKGAAQIFRRTLSNVSIGKAISLVMVSGLVIAMATMALLMTELGETPHILSRGKFLELLFETVSAFGTVGLSTGVTTNLTTAGKLIITLVMFVGRLGPLVIALAVSQRKTPRFQYAEETVMIG